jgi:signal peptidase
VPFWHAKELLRLPMDVLGGGTKQDTKQELTLDVLRGHGRCRLQVSGTSMLPTLWPGDAVSIESRPLSRMGVGDIVLYERDGRFFLHRLVALPMACSAGMLITRGDAMPQADPPIPEDALLGVVAGVRRGEDWVTVPKTMSRMSRLAGALLARSRGLALLVLHVRSGGNYAARWQKKNRGKDGAPTRATPELFRRVDVPEAPAS